MHSGGVEAEKDYIQFGRASSHLTRRIWESPISLANFRCKDQQGACFVVSKDVAKVKGMIMSSDDRLGTLGK